MEQLHDKILAKRAETERQLGQISAAIDIAMRSASAPGALEAGGQPAAAFLALPRFQVSLESAVSARRTFQDQQEYERCGGNMSGHNTACVELTRPRGTDQGA